MTAIPPEPGTPTQVAHPWRSVLRTLVAAAVGAGIAWLVRQVGIDLTTFSGAIIDWITAAVWTVGTAVIQWLLTRPKLLPFWQAIGLGTGVETEKPPVSPAGYREVEPRWGYVEPRLWDGDDTPPD